MRHASKYLVLMYQYLLTTLLHYYSTSPHSRDPTDLSGSVAPQVLTTSVAVVWSMWSYDVVLHYVCVILLRMHVYVYTYYTTYASIRKY